MLEPSAWLLEFLKKFEGCRLTAYKDEAGVLTIGYGHTGPEVKSGDTITELQAVTLLKADVSVVARAIISNVRVALNQNQFDALCSLVFNIGTRRFQDSTLLKQINCSGERNVILEAMEFPRWRFIGGIPSRGLLRRRFLEAEHYLAQN